MPRGKSKESPYAELSDEFKSKAAGADWNQLNDLIAEVARDEQENQQMKSDDPDLAMLKEQVKVASEPYRNASKDNKLKTKFLIELQEAKGRPAAKSDTPVTPVAPILRKASEHDTDAA